MSVSEYLLIERNVSHCYKCMVACKQGDYLAMNEPAWLRELTWMKNEYFPGQLQSIQEMLKV